MRKTGHAALLVAAIVGGSMGCHGPAGSPECADVLLTGGLLHTVDADLPTAEAMALRGSRILAVGTASDLEERHLCEGSTERVELNGRTVIPGLIDAHAHLLRLGDALRRVDLNGTRSYDEVLERIARRVDTARPGEWILGRGWDQNDWPTTGFPTRERLDAISPDNPVVMDRVDGHAVLANRLALEAGGIGPATPDPDGGEILRDARGNATGVLIDNATRLVESTAPVPDREQNRSSLRLAVEHCLSLGLTGMHDAGMGFESSDHGARLGLALWDLYGEMADAGELGIRVYGMLSGPPAATGPYFPREPEIGRADGMLTVRSIKLYADGALGSRGAALLEDYSDRAGHRGLMVTPPDQMEAVVREALQAGYQVAIHAIGDRGNREVLDLYERALADAPPGDHRLRVEHVQVVATEDLERFASLGILPSMQPTHATSDMYWAGQRVGEARLAGAYAWRSLLRSGVDHLPLGSDFPVESANPFWGWYAAMTRQDAEGYPEGGWRPEERLTRAEALKGFTLDAAHAAFQEADLGSLSEGKYADFLILDRDPMTVSPEELRETVVLETWVGGRRAWSRP